MAFWTCLILAHPMWAAVKRRVGMPKGTSKQGESRMQGDPMDCRLKQVEPRQSAGVQAEFEDATNEQDNDRMG